MIALLTSRLAGPIATGGCVLLALALGVQTVKLSIRSGDLRDARAQVSRLTADLATCRANTAGLRTSLDEQNAAVIALRARTEAAEEAGRLARAEAERAQASARARATVIREAVPTSDDDCEAAGTLAAGILFGGLQ